MQPLVGGESARLVLDTIRGFPLSVSNGRTTYELIGSPAGMAALSRAYECVEREVIVEAEQCTTHLSHRTVDEEEFRHIVLRGIVRRAKLALGERHVLDPIWESHL